MVLRIHPEGSGQKSKFVNKSCFATPIKNKKPLTFVKGFSKKRRRVEGYARQRRTNKKKNPQLFQAGGSIKTRGLCPNWRSKGGEPTRRGGEHVAPIKNKKACLFRQAFLKKGDDILSHKLQYHLRRRA